MTCSLKTKSLVYRIFSFHNFSPFLCLFFSRTPRGGYSKLNPDHSAADPVSGPSYTSALSFSKISARFAPIASTATFFAAASTSAAMSVEVNLHPPSEQLGGQSSTKVIACWTPFEIYVKVTLRDTSTLRAASSIASRSSSSFFSFSFRFPFSQVSMGFVLIMKDDDVLNGKIVPVANISIPTSIIEENNE